MKNNNIVINYKKLDKDSIVPKYSRQGDAGLDISSIEETSIDPSEIKLIKTGIAISLPVNTCALVLPRSGLAIKHGITVINAPGLIDSNYRGELMVGLVNHSKSSFSIHKGDRIAQLLVLNCNEVLFNQVEFLDTTNRNDAGFGSSGIS